MNSKTPLASLVTAVTPLVSRVESIGLWWENELVPYAGMADVERRVAREFAARGVVITPWHGRMPAAKAALASGCATRLDGALELSLGPGVSRTLRVLVATPPGRQAILFLSLGDGFFSGGASPYEAEARQLRADSLAFAIAVDALLAAAIPGGGPFVSANDWNTAPAVALLRRRHLTHLNLLDVCDAGFDEVLPDFHFPPADDLAGRTALQAGLKTADVITAENSGLAGALRDPAWPIYTEVLARHLQKEVGRIEALTDAPFVEMRPEWDELRRRLGPDAHAAGSIFAQDAMRRRVDRLPRELRRVISSRMVFLTGGRCVAQKLFEVALAAARRVLAEGNFRGFFVFAPLLPGDELADRRRVQLRALSRDFPRDVLVIENDAAAFAAMRSVADAQIFCSAWEPHAPVFFGPAVPVAFGEWPCVQVKSWRTRGGGARLQARFHESSEPRNGFWLYPQAAPPSPLLVDQWRALAVGLPAAEPPAAACDGGNLVFGAMVKELAAVLRLMGHCWSTNPIAYAAWALAALERQERWARAGAGGHGRIFELIAAVRRRPERAS